MTLLVAAVLAWPACQCGTGAGETTVCEAPPPPCGEGQMSALDVFSRRGCSGAVESYWCGVNAQELAQCLRDAQVCLELGSTRDQISAALAVSACAAQFEAWDTCFANGEAEGGGDDDDD